MKLEIPFCAAVLIRDGVDGLLVPSEDVSALTAALDRLMGNARERERLAARAPEVLDRFSLARTLDLWQELFDQVIRAPRTGPGDDNI